MIIPKLKGIVSNGSIVLDEKDKIRQECSDYKNAVLFKDNLEEIIRICKKKGGYDY